ncbi:MAG: phosphoribosylaminoimidazolesuccinocarboxamide synthase [Acidobacteriota bacterium]
MTELVWQTQLGELTPRRGKVRDIYDLGDTLLIVACDRISAYDHILQPGIPGKGKILNQLSNFFFEHTASLVPNHLLATEPTDFPAALKPYADQLKGRAVLVRKTEVIPFECVARGYLAGSAFREYRASGVTCGHRLPEGLERASRLASAIFTPATKAESGHDENVSQDFMANALGAELTNRLAELTLRLYWWGHSHGLERGVLLADTKFEFGQVDGQVLLIDEMLTPDSSRYWEKDTWTPGTEPASFDKQFVRNWLDSTGWDHESAPPPLTDEVTRGTLARYVEAFRRLTGREPELG